MTSHDSHPSSVPPPELVRFTAATFARPGGGAALADLTWAARGGQTWAVVGPVGAGKTTFADAVAGTLVLRAGEAEWPLVARARAAGRDAYFPRDVVRTVSFKEQSRLFSYGQHYYQERFNFTDPLDDITLAAFLGAGATSGPEAVAAVATRLGVGSLLESSFITLSNGQVRRARIARALLAAPELLVLDEPFMGLDAAGREDVSRLLGELVAGGTRVLLITRPGAIPGWVTHVLELDGMRVRWQGPVEAYARQEKKAETENVPVPVSGAAADSPPVLELRDVTVRYGSRAVLHGVSWTVRAGERWALLGPNGSGKSTLLSLACGDHPQAYGNDVRVFGRRRGTGESIWDVKRRIGLVSPELHLYFNEPLSAARAAATGFHDVMAARPTTPDQGATVRRLFAEFGLTEVADRPFARLSTGQQRLVLLVRALVKEPELLILDEPFQGLDRPAIDHAKEWLDRHLRADQTLIFVSHHADEIPASVNRLLRLSEGHVAEMR
ncbi:ATP-binding cassette domain-containing protein [Fimbriiglobus ruber]|uniref:ABC transporter, ATP-binding protein n=1 Tax=Fimbriiglobus ruber TaxID=1908690 RepID=A0A225DHZ5_9BACT|nr:ATP-binding cassette domain-containing protein [Fimbriiglobus ruber]OWK35985.1 ABC transporter, ATP-binding protein [Fimbriiglobus ruber]